MENSEATDEIEVTPGQRLREARESAGMSPREMADRLNWLPAHVGAIENDRYEELKGAAFIRGYLRAYARAVGLNEDDIVGLYAALQPEHEAATRANAAASSSVPSQNTGMAVVLGVAVAAVVIGAIWWKQQGADSAAPASPEPAKTSAVAENGAATPQPATAQREETDSSTDSFMPAAADSESLPAEQTDSERESIAAVAVEPSGQAVADTGVEPVEVAAPAAASAVASDGALQFSFSGDCWLEVRDGEGQLIYADLRRAGDTLGLDGRPPFEILAGDAAAVSLSYLGEPVAMQTRPGRDTARFTVGEP